MNKLVIGNKNYSSWSLRAWILLKQLNIDFEEIKIPLFTDDFKEKILQYSQSGLVPAFVTPQMAIWDSLAIAEYIAELSPEADCWPKEQGARAFARSVSCEMHSGFMTIRSELPMNCRKRTFVEQIPEQLQSEIDRICNIWTTCRKHFGTKGDFLFGNFSIADAMYAPVVIRFNNYGITVGEVESAYMQTMLSLDSLQQWIRQAVDESEVIEKYDN